MAKIDARRVAAFLRDPGAVRLAVLFGDDAGLVRERSDALRRAVVAGGDDPFRTAELSREQAQRAGTLAGEAAALSMTGGRRVVRVRDASDAHAAAAREVLAGAGEALVILEAGELTRASKLRALAEGPGPVAAVECWRERGAELAASIGGILGELGVRAEPAALDWLAERLGEDRGTLRRALEVLALHAGPGGTLGEEEVAGLVGDGSALDLDEGLMAATAGDAAKAEHAFAAAFAEGTNPVQALRAAQRHLQRLHLAAIGVAAGQPAGIAMNALRPPVFFRHKPAFEQALRRWRPAALEAAAAAMANAEARAKSGGTGKPLPDRAIARQALLALARSGRAG